MKAPERIYLHPTAKGEVGASWLTLQLTDKDIEYIRKDTVIEKIEEFIYSALNDGIMGTANIEDFIRLFKKYMEE